MQPVEATLYSLSDAVPSPPCATAPEPERRAEDRLLTLYRVGSLMLEDRRELCLIKNISAGGMMIRAYSEIAVGTELSVEFKCGELLPGRASWVRGSNVGIAFNSPVDVVDILTASLDRPRPRMPRIEIDTFVTVRDGAMLHRLRALDISQGGVKLDYRTELVPGTSVIVTVPGLEPQPAVVRWSIDGQMGIAFNRLVTLTGLIEWLKQQREPISG